MPEPLLAATGLAKSYPDGTGRLTVLRNVDLALAAGETVAIVGRSGCGKSTLMHLLGLLDRPTAGALALLGRDVSRLSERARTRLRSREIGFVFQNYHLLADFSAAENVMAARALGHGGGFGAANRRRAMEALAALGLAERAKARPAEMSGGERQRVAAARALAVEPSLLLCDEPTGNLDPETGALVMRRFLGAARDSGAAMVLVTHDAETAAAATRVLRMEDGSLAGLTGP